MSYPFTEDHDMIREAVRGFLQEIYDNGQGPERIYQSGVAFDDAGWTSFAKELGMAGIAISEAHGGAGLGDLGLVVVMEELGASLASFPFLASAVSGNMLSRFGSDAAKAAYLPKLAAGELTACYAKGHDDALALKNGKLTGQIKGVADAGFVDVILVSLKDGSEIKLLALPKDVAGLNIHTHTTLDPTRSFATLALDGVNLADVDMIGEPKFADLNAQAAISQIALAAECVGGAGKCLEITLGYTAERIQFDRPIASFQAVKHRCADMYVALEAARSAVYAAASAVEDDKYEAALIAKAYASDAFFKIAGDAIQMHGGIGFTWEYPLHFFFKRARANRAMYGTSVTTYRQLADSLWGEMA